MSILIIGADGSMGKRYQAIFKYLGKSVILADVKHNLKYVKAAAAKSEGIVICTPTDTHISKIREVISAGKPILCEKPVTKNMNELRELASELAYSKNPFRMVFQYQLLAERRRIGRSHYNYFRHGSDGLVWDCMQIVALSHKNPSLSEDSPLWSCMINGKALSLSTMDAAYIGYVQKWFKEPRQDIGEILDAHEKTDAMAKETSFVIAH